MSIQKRSTDSCSTGEETWRKVLLTCDASVQEAICSLNDSSLQIVLAVSDDSTLVGTVTDGDIRRGLLRGLDLSSPIDSIINRDAMVVSPQLSREMALHLMQVNAIGALPIVDESRRVLGLHLLNSLISPQRVPNLMVIMAGGQGKRMRPHTENCPKPMLPVGKKPMLEHIVNRAIREGFQHFVMAVNYLGSMIEEHFGDGSPWQVRIDYLREDLPLGTAGALGLLEPHPKDPFLVSNGDVLTDVRYGELLEYHCRSGAVATMAVRLHEWQVPFGVVQTEGVDITAIEEKPVIKNYVNAGIYVLDPCVLKYLRAGEPCDMPALFHHLREEGRRTIVYPIHELWLDVGKPDDLKWAQDQNLAE